MSTHTHGRSDNNEHAPQDKIVGHPGRTRRGLELDIDKGFNGRDAYGKTGRDDVAPYPSRDSSPASHSLPSSELRVLLQHFKGSVGES
jgi:hypothetical protein